MNYRQPSYAKSATYQQLNQQADLAKQLQMAIKQLQIEVSEPQQQQLLALLQALLFWNKTYNLTAIREPKAALVKHIIDALSILPYLPSGDLLDVGTGAGIPGLIIAICQPQRQCVLLDSNQKKVRFIKQMAAQLALANVLPIAERIEEHTSQYDVIVSRAFASLLDFVQLTSPRLTQTGMLCAMKGLLPCEEIDKLQSTWQISSPVLVVPMLDEVRHLVQLTPKIA